MEVETSFYSLKSAAGKALQFIIKSFAKTVVLFLFFRLRPKLQFDLAKLDKERERLRREEAVYKASY